MHLLILLRFLAFLAWIVFHLGYWPDTIPTPELPCQRSSGVHTPLVGNSSGIVSMSKVMCIVRQMCCCVDIVPSVPFIMSL